MQCAWFVALSLVTVGQEKKDAPTAEEIVKKMAAKYAECRTYQDTGVVETTGFDKDGKKERVARIPFSLHFSRPSKFRFEWTHEFIGKRKRVVWSDGKTAYTYWEPDRYVETMTLRMAIAGATGVSRGSAQAVPGLLIEKEDGPHVEVEARSPPPRARPRRALRPRGRSGRNEEPLDGRRAPRGPRGA